MIVLRSDLLTGFKKKLFEIELKTKNNNNLVLENNKLTCELSSKTSKYGFKLSGFIFNNTVYCCDRCLKEYIINDKIKTNFFISNQKNDKVISAHDVLYWSDEDDRVNLKDTLLEILFVEIPFKKLCSNNCKGICLDCGSDLNNKSCSCKN
tara:strand:+ start:1660 stop:2112 length:453 start_codon:yes stop_codon:yes gene_type:complete